MSDGNAVLMQGGLPSAKFPTIGTTVKGVVIDSPTKRQATDPATGEPKTFKNGDPMLQVVVSIRTDDRDPTLDNDNGERALYIGGGMIATVRDAVRRAGAAGLEPGGTITVTYIGDGTPAARGLSAPKQYSAQYVPPSVGNAALMGNGQAAAAPAETIPPCPSGVDPGKWAAMAPAQRDAVLAALGQPAMVGTPGPGY